MEKFELIAPCHFGMEAVLKREILDLGYEITKVEDGKVTFEADAQGIADANIFLRSTERILLLFTHHYSARCFGMNMPKSRDIQAKIPLPQAIWNEFWLSYCERSEQ